MPERANGKDHTHTLNAGLHQFNFEFIVPPDLPPTMRSYSGSATVEYRLKAVVARSGFASSNLTCKRSIPLHRGLGSEAIEFNSTVEIG